MPTYALPDALLTHTTAFLSQLQAGARAVQGGPRAAEVLLAYDALPETLPLSIPLTETSPAKRLKELTTVLARYGVTIVESKF